MAEALAQLDVWRGMPTERAWLEFKAARQQFDLDDFGRYVSALANEANLAGRDAAWLVFGVLNERDPARACGRFAAAALLPMQHTATTSSGG